MGRQQAATPGGRPMVQHLLPRARGSGGKAGCRLRRPVRHGDAASPRPPFKLRCAGPETATAVDIAPCPRLGGSAGAAR